MMAIRAYRLRMTAPLHVGDQGVGLEETLAYVPSDTLFSAVVTWSHLAAHAGIVDSLDESFSGMPPLRLTSAFPFAHDVYLLPKPQLAMTPDDPAGSGKQYKRVRWVSFAVFSALASGIRQRDLDTLWAERMLLQQGAVWTTREEYARLAGVLEPDGEVIRIWSTLRVPKVTIDRVHNAGTLFHVGRVHFARGCGLWFLAQGEQDWLQRVEDALAVLADSGLGGQRSRGNGQFVMERSTPPEFKPPVGMKSYGVLLSRLAPTVNELHLLRCPSASYSLATVAGWSGDPVSSPVIRKQVRMLAEGSVVGWTDKKLGQLIDVTPDKAPVSHPLYRNGIGYLVPIQVPTEALP